MDNPYQYCINSVYCIIYGVYCQDLRKLSGKFETFLQYSLDYYIKHHTFASAFGLQPGATKKEFFEKLRYRDKEKVVRGKVTHYI